MFASLESLAFAYLIVGSSYIGINYCPWCGGALPLSLRDEWFEEIERLGLEPESPTLPWKYSTDEWWIDRAT